MSKRKVKGDGSLFFRQNDSLPMVSLALILIGIACMWLGFTWVSYIIAIIFVPVGVVLFFVFNSRRVSQNGPEEERDHLLRDYDLSVKTMEYADRILLKQPADVETAAYSMGDDARYFKRGKGGTVISDVFVKTHIYFTRTGIVYAARTVRLSEMDAEKQVGFTDAGETLYFADMVSAALDQRTDTVTLTRTGKSTSVRWVNFVITGREGELLRLPVANDMDVSNLCDEINRRLEDIRRGKA